MANDALKALANTLKADIAKTTADLAGVLKLGNNRRTDAALKPVTDDLKKETTDVAAVIAGINALDGTTTKTATTTALGSSPNPSNAGQEVTLTAAVKAASGSPTGSVQFWNGSAVIGTVMLINGGAVLKTSALAVGSYSLAVTYSGDATFAASASATLMQKVNAVVQTGTPAMTVYPAWDLGSVGPKGGPFTPQNIGYDVKNTGTGALHWSATPGQSWATATPASGTLAAGETVEVVIAVNSAANVLDVGWPEASVAFKNSDNGVGDTTRAVKLTVTTGTTTTELTLGPSSLSGGTKGSAYNETVGANGGTAPYSYSVIGALPAGLSLNVSSGAITGTPTTPTSYTFTIQAKDAAGKTVTRDYTIVVSSSVTTTGPTVFAPSSFWYQPIPVNATLHPNSAGMTADLIRQKDRYFKTVGINTEAYCASIFVAPAGTPTVKVNSIRDFPVLQAQWLAVPIPSWAKPASGTDSEMCIHQPSSDTMWEFWQAEHRADGSWWANWGGKMDNVSKDNGIWDDVAGRWGTTATGLPFMGGQITAEELKAGEIKHVLGFSVVEALGWATFSWPANRSDGWSPEPDNPNLPAEGLRLRLDPAVNVDALAIHPTAKIICKALQKYGAVIWDRGGSLGFRCNNSDAYRISEGDDPYWPNNQYPGTDGVGLFGGRYGYTLFDGVPWDRMQFMPMNYGMP